MTAAVFDIIVEQGATFELVVDLLDEDGEPRTDLAGYTGAMQIREEKSPTSTLLGTATVTIDTANAQLTATIAAATTAAYAWAGGYYDVTITKAAVIERVAQGRATLSAQITG